MRRSRAAILVKDEHAEVKAEAVGPAIKADVLLDQAEATLDALAGPAATPCAAGPKGSEDSDSLPFPGFARPLPYECMVKRWLSLAFTSSILPLLFSQQLG